MTVQLRYAGVNEYVARITGNGPTLTARITAVDGWVLAGAVFHPDGTTSGLDDRPAIGRAVRRAVARRDARRRSFADLTVEQAGVTR